MVTIQFADELDLLTHNDFWPKRSTSSNQNHLRLGESSIIDNNGRAFNFHSYAVLRQPGPLSHQFPPKIGEIEWPWRAYVACHHRIPVRMVTFVKWKKGSWNAARFSTYVEVYGSWIMERSQNVIEFQSSGKMSLPMQPFSFATISRGFSRHDARVHAETHEKSSLWKLW